jgi:hypothetical protein
MRTRPKHRNDAGSTNRSLFARFASSDHVPSHDWPKDLRRAITPKKDPRHDPRILLRQFTFLANMAHSLFAGRRTITTNASHRHYKGTKTCAEKESAIGSSFLRRFCRPVSPWRVTAPSEKAVPASKIPTTKVKVHQAQRAAKVKALRRSSTRAPLRPRSNAGRLLAIPASLTETPTLRRWQQMHAFSMRRRLLHRYHPLRPDRRR